MKKGFCAAVLAAFLLTGCGRTDQHLPDTPANPAEFVGIEEIADTENGWIMVPSGFVCFRENDAGLSGLTQCADPTGVNVITLEYYRGYDFTEVYDQLRREIAGTVSNVQFSDEQHPVQLGSCRAHQILCRSEKNGRTLDMGIWIAEDAGASEPSCYYLAIETDEDHLGWLDLAQTFRTRREYLSAQ